MAAKRKAVKKAAPKKVLKADLYRGCEIVAAGGAFHVIRQGGEIHGEEFASREAAVSAINWYGPDWQ